MRFSRRMSAWIAVLALLGALCVPAMARGRYLGELEVVNCRSYVTLREYASTSAPAVTTVPLGATVEAYYYNSRFTECTYRGRHGYILSSYLSEGSDSDYLGKRYVVNCREYVTLRRHPSTSASAVTRVYLGEQVEAYYYDGTFCRCYYDGREGYILSKYLGKSRREDPTRGDFIGELKVYNCDDWVSLREYPSTSAGRAAKVPYGEIVSAYDCPGNRDFYFCEWKGREGFILRDYLR